MKRNLSYLILSFCLVATGCVAPRLKQPMIDASIPNAYDALSDTANDGKQPWKMIYKDPLLVRIIDSCVQRNWDVRDAIQNMRVADAEIIQRKGASAPFVTGGASAGFAKFGEYTMDGAGNIGTKIYDGRFIPVIIPDYAVGIQTAWEIDIWGKLKSRRKAAVNRFVQSSAMRNAVLTNLVAQAATHYYELTALDNQLDIIAENIAIQQDALEMVKVQKEAGSTTLFAVEQCEAQLLALQSMQYEARQKIVVTEAALCLLMGVTPHPIARNKRSLMEDVPPALRHGLPYHLLLQRPDVRAAEMGLLAAGADVYAARAAFYPSLNITGALGFKAFLPSVLFSSPQSLSYSLFGGLMAPLLNRSALKTAYKQADAQMQKALIHYERVSTTAYAEVFVQLAAVQNLEKKYLLQQKRSAILKQSTSTTSDLFRSGRSTYLEVLIAQQNALTARLGQVDTRKEMYRAAINTYKVLGGGWN